MWSNSPNRRTLFEEWIRTARAVVTSPPAFVLLGAEDLATAADRASEQAAIGRGRPYRARRAVSSMVLLLMAFESWVNHHLTIKLLFSRETSQTPDSALMTLLLRGGLAEKARQIPRYAGGRALTRSEHPELEQLLLIRHELIHELRASNVRGDINRLEILEASGMLITARPGTVEYMHHERLASYDLAWWAWGTVCSVVKDILAAKVSEDTFDERHNFDLPRQWHLPSPEAIEADIVADAPDECDGSTTDGA
jgi:hypothetical protein